jgi:hypothetical protein
MGVETYDFALPCLHQRCSHGHRSGHLSITRFGLLVAHDAHCP